jgi:hypothetical protein
LRGRIEERGKPVGLVTRATSSIASARAAFPPLGEGKVAHAAQVGAGDNLGPPRSARGPNASAPHTKKREGGSA